MKLVVFGTSRGIGKEVVTQAAMAGHQVIAVVRDEVPATQSGPVQFVRGSVTDAAFVARVVTGCDAVISTVGTDKYKQPLSLYSDGAKALIAGMEESGVRRLIVISAGGAVTEANDPLVFKLVFKPLLQRQFRYLYADMMRMERLLEASDLDWTSVRPSYLVTKPVTGKYRTAHEAAIPYGFSISRSDVAHYILHNLNNDKEYRHHVSIAN